MKRLILDFVHRWAWGYALACVIVAVFMTLSFTTMSNAQPIYPVAVYFGAFLLSFDFVKGSARVFASLPLSTREIGRAWWHLGVTLPVMLVSLIRLLILLILSRVQPFFSIDWTLFLISTLWDSIYAGSAFFILTFQPVALKGALSGSQKILGGIWGASWGLAFGSVALVGAMLPGSWQHFNAWTTLAMMAGGCLTVAAYLRSDQSAVTRMAFRSTQFEKRPKYSTPPRYSIGQTLVGIPQLIWTLFTGVGIASVAFFVIMAAVDTVLRGQPWGLFLDRLGSGTILGSNASYWFCAAFVVVGTNMRFVVGIRHLRTLPLNSTRLNLLCVVPTVITCAIIWGVPVIFSLAFAYRIPSAIYCAWYVAFTGICSLTHSFLLHSSRRSTLFVAMILLLPAVAAAQSWIEWGARIGSPALIPTLLLIGVVGFLTAIWSIRRSLTHGSSAYRPKEIAFLGGIQGMR